MARALTAVLAVLLAGVGSGTARGAALFDPALRFHVLRTEHFAIYFHQGEERMAERLSTIAEEAWRALQRPLGVTPPRRTHVVLADQTEFANGFATPLPYDTIVIYTVWPQASSEFVFDDWLRLAFTHEFTHIVHLDRSEGWARFARGIFGRMPYAFPNLYLPPWQIEGLATYEESAITGEGRLHAGDFRAIVREAARARLLEPLDRVNGGLTDWPASAAPYAYGVEFHDYLVRRFGAETLASLAAATARRVPYTSTRAFLYVYGESLGELWRDFEADRVSAAPSPPALDAGAARLTRHGFSVSGPRFDRFGCSACPPAIFYAAASPRGFPSLARVALDGSAPRQVTTRYLGSTTAIGRDTIYFDQMEVRRNVGIYSDLYALSRADGGVRALTSNARLRDPDLSPDGGTLVATQERAGQRDLVTVRVDANGRVSIATLAGTPDVYFDAPRWSPDGRSIAVARHRLGAQPEIAIVDAATGRIRVVAADAHTRFATPAWRPDGSALVVAAAPEDETFNLFEVAADGSALQQLTHTSGGALWPDVSPDGATIAFAGYTTGGYDVFTMPYPRPDRGQTGVGLVSDTSPTPSSSIGPTPLPTAHRYNPLTTLTPTSWSPVIVAATDQVRVGAAFDAVDVLGYHAYAGDATWLVSGPAGAPTPAAASPDWTISYAYSRWRPTFYAAASSSTSFFAGPATDSGAPSAATRRERTVEAGMLLPFRHVRAAHAALISVLRSANEYTLPSTTVTRNVTPLRAAWETATARTYGYSVSREDGVVAGATAEIVRQRLGSAGDATTITADARAYLPGAAAHHVLALRASGGSSAGDPTVGRTFLLGGGAADRGAMAFDSRASSLLRGFPDATFAGSRVALVNAEYRWPIARPQRGVGTWPVFLHTMSGAAFVDAGEAWTRAFRSDALKTSAGAELSAVVVLGYFAPVTFTVGAAWGHDAGGAIADRAAAYIRVGKAF